LELDTWYPLPPSVWTPLTVYEESYGCYKQACFRHACTEYLACVAACCEQVPAARLQAGVYRCHAPPHEAGTVGLCITYGDGRPRSNVQPFTYRATPLTARAQDDLCVFPADPLVLQPNFSMRGSMRAPRGGLQAKRQLCIPLLTCNSFQDQLADLLLHA
jgi:hypothetical protein